MNRTSRGNDWLASPAIAVSLVIHVVALLYLLMRPRDWPWALGAVVLNHAILTAAGLWPRSRLLGANWLTLPPSTDGRRRVAITIDDGPDPDVTPQVLTQLAAYGARATFFCVGAQVEQHADLAREIVRRGHAIENHSQQHRHTFSLLGPRGMRAEIDRAQRSIELVTGRRPRFFRAPAGLRNPFLDPILRGLQLTLASWTRRGFDTVNGDPERVYARLVRNLDSGDILLLHDGHAARSAAGAPVILAVLPRLLRELQSRGLTTVTLHETLT